MKPSLLNFALLSMVIFTIASCGGEKDPVPIDCSVSDLALVIENVDATSSCSSSDGSIETSATGGVSPYQFQINNGDVQGNGNFNDLAPGVYSITITDDAGCTFSEDVTVEGANFTITAQRISDAGCTTAEGSFSVQSDHSNLEFKIDDGDYQTSNTFSNLAVGTYNITAKDNTGCESTATHRVLSGTSYDLDIKPILKVNCVDPGCHNSSAPQPDWSVYENVKANAANIKTRTQNKSMPKTGSLTQEEIDLIACWVDDGALNN